MIPDKKVRALVVDDDVDMGRFLSSHLVRRGFDVGNACHGGRSNPDTSGSGSVVVLLDLSAPGMGSLDILERIKQIKPELEWWCYQRSTIRR